MRSVGLEMPDVPGVPRDFRARVSRDALVGAHAVHEIAQEALRVVALRPRNTD